MSKEERLFTMIIFLGLAISNVGLMLTFAPIVIPSMTIVWLMISGLLAADLLVVAWTLRLIRRTLSFDAPRVIWIWLVIHMVVLLSLVFMGAFSLTGFPSIGYLVGVPVWLSIRILSLMEMMRIRK